MGEGGRSTVPGSISFAQTLAYAGALACAGCSTVPQAPPSTDAAITSVMVAKRSWHTDICIRNEDAGPWAVQLTTGFDGARFLCFGFGERQYVVTHQHDPLTTLSALLPSRAALLMTVLRAPPAEAFGPANVAELGIGQTGLNRLRDFLRQSVQSNAAGQPMRLADGPYPGSVFFGATQTYDAFYTCNTWTADALRSAGLPVRGVLFSGSLMREVRRLGAAEP
jgi:uncharacterized protein (TIGR02117 family)